MGLDIPDEALRRRAQLNAPRLRDALRTALATYASTYYRDRTAPDPTELTRHHAAVGRSRARRAGRARAAGEHHLSAPQG